MSPFIGKTSPRILRWELPFVCLLAWIAFVSIPIYLGEIGLSWDALNHHIYLGWTAEKSRFDRDFLAAGYQSHQFPYLYWPVYKLATSGWSGLSSGIVLATLHMIAVPPVWMLARVCMPGATAFDAAMRLMAVVLAFSSPVVLSLFDSSSNDLMAAAPLVWALALGMEPLRKNRAAWLTPTRAIILSGLFAGVAVAFKLSNGPLAVLLPFVWLFSGDSLWGRARLMVIGSAAMLVGFAMAYGHWGALLWSHFGNPVYPFYEHLFAPVRDWVGWQP